MRKNTFAVALAGFCAGAVNGLLGAGGGMILVPLLTQITDLEEGSIFPSSISIILPICLVSLGWSIWAGTVDFQAALPYLVGSVIGGFLAGKWGQHIPTKWLHRLLGILILWGGIRYLW